ncbi:MAG: hypothetical protein A2Z18_09840 [Armatimonadetes bacterium RBG_16_58_9]|nr:MAG: hypothetical protein A2Z18_09840 [Armatimonadetes bacterium RBG_16_58_9]
MYLSRLHKLKAVFALLVPYVAFSVGSEYMHNHAGQNLQWRSGSYKSAAIGHVRSSGSNSIYVASSAATNGRECPACTWARTSVSGPHVISTAVQTDVVSDFIPLECYPYRAGCSSPFSSRAPPIG